MPIVHCATHTSGSFIIMCHRGSETWWEIWWVSRTYPPRPPKKLFLPPKLEFKTEHAHEKTGNCWFSHPQPCCDTLLVFYVTKMGPSAHDEVTDMHSPGNTIFQLQTSPRKKTDSFPNGLMGLHGRLMIFFCLKFQQTSNH